MFFFSIINSLLKQKKHLLCSLTLLLFSLILLSDVVVVQAADFKHSHANTCYSTKSGPCTATHNLSTATSTTTRHCPNCVAQKAHTTYVYWDWCQGTSQRFEQGGYHICNTCGGNSYSWGSNSRRIHNVSRQVLSCGNSNGVNGTLWIKNVSDGWTTEPVTINAGVTIYNNSLVLDGQPYSWDNGVTWSGEAAMQVEENGTYTVHARSNTGVMVGETINVNNIDRTGPVLGAVEKSTSEWTNQDVTISVLACDLQPDGTNGCGLAEEAYSYDLGSTFVSDNCISVSCNGLYEIQLKDSLGNLGQAEFEISNIDKNAPDILEVAQVNEGWQSESVIMKVHAIEGEGESGLHEAAYSLDDENWQGDPEFLFTENGTYTVYVRDIAGNGKIHEFVVDGIDVTAPVVENIQTLPDRIWEDRVEVAINAKDLQPDGSTGCGLNECAYSVDGGLTWQESNVFVIESGMTYDVRVRDALLWESEEYILERKDLPYPPPIVNKKTDIDNEPAYMDNTQQQEENIKEPVLEESMQEETVDKEDFEKSDEQDMEETPYIDWDAGKKAIMEGSYVFGNMYDAESGSIEAQSGHDSGYNISETVELQENAGPNTREARVIVLPWYETTIGKTAIISTGAISVGILMGFVCYMIIFSVRVYCVAEEHKIHKLGRVYIHRTKEGYSVVITDLMLEKALIPRYRIKVSPILLKRVENARLLVQSSEKNLEVLLQESIDFEL